MRLGVVLFQKIFSPVWRISCAFGRFFLRFIFLPIYTFLVLTKMRLEKTLVSARGFVFFILTNRYVFHVVLFIIALGTIGSQLQTKQVAALDAGQNSLLYSLVTQGQEQTIEEDLHATSDPHTISYLGPDTLEAPATGIDDDSVDTSPADLTIPGSLAVQPHSDFTPDEPLPASPDTTPTDTLPTQTPGEPRPTVSTYIVRSGDNVASIAHRFQVDINTVLWANNLNTRAAITPGDSLRIPSQSGVLHVVKRNQTIKQIADLYDVSQSDITTANHLNSRGAVSVGQELLIPGGSPRALASATPTTPTRVTPPTPPVRANVPVSTIPGKSVDAYQESTKSEGDTRNKPEDAPIKATSKLQWPTVLHVINQYYGWQHTGVDIDGDYTDAIYAADDGIVTQAGWNNGGYGLMVLIDHQNGYVTRYGHSSKLFVKAGDHVKRGQVIAMIGTTGRSTGTHLHFEVYVNGKRTNPLAYIK